MESVKAISFRRRGKFVGERGVAFGHERSRLVARVVRFARRFRKSLQGLFEFPSRHPVGAHQPVAVAELVGAEPKLGDESKAKERHFEAHGLRGRFRLDSLILPTRPTIGTHIESYNLRRIAQVLRTSPIGRFQLRRFSQTEADGSGAGHQHPRQIATLLVKAFNQFLVDLCPDPRASAGFDLVQRDEQALRIGLRQHGIGQVSHGLTIWIVGHSGMFVAVSDQSSRNVGDILHRRSSDRKSRFTRRGVRGVGARCPPTSDVGLSSDVTSLNVEC